MALSGRLHAFQAILLEAGSARAAKLRCLLLIGGMCILWRLHAAVPVGCLRQVLHRTYAAAGAAAVFQLLSINGEQVGLQRADPVGFLNPNP